MNSNLGAAWSGMHSQRKKKESDLLKETSKLPRKQPAKEKSPNTQQTDYLRAVKTNSYAESRAGEAPTCSEQTPV